MTYQRNETPEPLASDADVLFPNVDGKCNCALYPNGQTASAYDLGFRRAAKWAQREDLFADVDSPAYKNDRSDDLMGMFLGKAAFPGDLCKRCYGSGRDPAPTDAKP